MVVVISYETETTIAVSAEKVFKVFVLESDTLLPKIVPQAIVSCETVEGDGGPGSIKKITFGGGHRLKFVKKKIEVVDKESFSYVHTIFEGGSLAAEKVEKISVDTKFLPSPDGGCTIKRHIKVYKKEDSEITEEQVKTGIDKFAEVFKSVEAYFRENPDAQI